MTRTFTFKHCWVNCSPGYTETVFHDGRRVPAVPDDSDEYREKAIRYGYGTDCAAMSREHELLHTFLAEYLGLGSSPTLWALGHPEVDGVAEICEQMEEESYVLAFQTFMNTGIPSADLDPLREACLNLDCLRNKAIKLMR